MSRFLFVLVFLGLLHLPAHAYFDPGAGVVMLQVLIAGGIGLIYRFRAWIGGLLQALVRLLKR